MNSSANTQLTNLKARLRHSPIPERGNVQKPIIQKFEESIQPETRIIPPLRLRASLYSSSNHSISSSRESL